MNHLARARTHPMLVTLLVGALGFLMLALFGNAEAGAYGIGALTLVEAAKLSTNMLQRGVIETIVDESPVLSRLPFMEIEGNAYAYNREATLPGIAFRAVNAGYTESTGTINPFTESLKIMGGDADVDRFIIRTLGDRQNQLAFQTALKSKATAIKFTEAFFEGDSGVDTASFDGLKVRLTGAQQLWAGANGAVLTLSMVDDLIDAVVGGPDVLFSNGPSIRKLNDLVLATGGTVPQARTEFGRRVFSYAGIDLVDVGTGLDGTTRILGFDETRGASSVTASIYAVKFGEQQYVSGLTNGGIDAYELGELETKPAERVRIEFYAGIGIFHGRAAARLGGILA